MASQSDYANRTIATVAVSKVLRMATWGALVVVAISVLAATPFLLDYLTPNLPGSTPPLDDSFVRVCYTLVACLAPFAVLDVLFVALSLMRHRTLDIEAGALVACPRRFIGGRIPLENIAEVHIRTSGSLWTFGTDHGVALILDPPEFSPSMGRWCNWPLRLAFLLHKYHLLVHAIFSESEEYIATTIAAAAQEFHGKTVPIFVIEKSGRRCPYHSNLAPAVVRADLDPAIAPLVSRNVPCIECGYNLRRLPVSGVCPECGVGISRSMHSELLHFAQPQWVRSLRRAAVMLTAAGIIGLLWVLLDVPCLTAMAWGLRLPSVLALLIVVLAGSSFVLLWLGALPLTRREPGPSGNMPRSLFARLTRGALGLGIVWFVWCILAVCHLAPSKLSGPCFVWVNLLLATSLLWYVREIFARVPRYRMRTVTTAVAAIFLIMAIVMPLAAMAAASIHEPANVTPPTTSSSLPLKSQIGVVTAFLTITVGSLPAAFATVFGSLWIALRGVRSA